MFFKYVINYISYITIFDGDVYDSVKISTLWKKAAGSYLGLLLRVNVGQIRVKD